MLYGPFQGNGDIIRRLATLAFSFRAPVINHCVVSSDVIATSSFAMVSFFWVPHYDSVVFNIPNPNYL